MFNGAGEILGGLTQIVKTFNGNENTGDIPQIEKTVVLLREGAVSELILCFFTRNSLIRSFFSRFREKIKSWPEIATISFNFPFDEILHNINF